MCKRATFDNVQTWSRVHMRRQLRSSWTVWTCTMPHSMLKSELVSKCDCEERERGEIQRLAWIYGRIRKCIKSKHQTIIFIKSIVSSYVLVKNISVYRKKSKHYLALLSLILSVNCQPQSQCQREESSTPKNFFPPLHLL